MKKVKIIIETEVTGDYYNSSEFQELLSLIETGEAAEEIKCDDLVIVSVTITSEIE